MPKEGGKSGANAHQLKRLIHFFLDSEVRIAPAVNLFNSVLHVKSSSGFLLRDISGGELRNVWCLARSHSLGRVVNGDRIWHFCSVF